MNNVYPADDSWRINRVGGRVVDSDNLRNQEGWWPEMTDLEKRTSEMLRSVGISPNLLGFGHLKAAVALVYEDETYIRKVTKRLYPDVAKMCNTTALKVERSIRHAIESMYDTVGIDVSAAILKQAPKLSSGNMTNSNFIASMVEVLKCEEELTYW